MKEFKFILYITILAVFTRCTSTNKLTKIENVNLENKVLKEGFNKNYKNLSDSSNVLLWDNLVYYNRQKHIRKDTTRITQSAIVNLHFKNKSTLILTIFENSRQVQKMILKGRLRKKCFFIKKRLFILPIPAAWFYYKHKAILGIGENDKLIFREHINTFAWLLILSGGSSDYFTYKYSHLED